MDMDAALKVTLPIILAATTSAVTAHGQSLQQQELCAKQAKAYFLEYNADDQALRKAGITPVNSDYLSHYSNKLNRCFVLVTSTTSTDKRITKNSQLVDAFERRIYATFDITYPQEKPWDIYCELAPSLAETSNCSSQAEFDAFVSKYMEDK